MARTIAIVSRCGVKCGVEGQSVLFTQGALAHGWNVHYLANMFDFNRQVSEWMAPIEQDPSIMSVNLHRVIHDSRHCRHPHGIDLPPDIDWDVLFIDHSTEFPGTPVTNFLLNIAKQRGTPTIVRMHDEFFRGDLDFSKIDLAVVHNTKLQQFYPGSTVVEHIVPTAPIPQVVEKDIVGSFGLGHRIDHPKVINMLYESGKTYRIFDPFGTFGKYSSSEGVEVITGWKTVEELMLALSSCESILLWFSDGLSQTTSSSTAAFSMSSLRPVFINGHQMLSIYNDKATVVNEDNIVEKLNGPLVVSNSQKEYVHEHSPLESFAKMMGGLGITPTVSEPFLKPAPAPKKEVPGMIYSKALHPDDYEWLGSTDQIDSLIDSGFPCLVGHYHRRWEYLLCLRVLQENNAKNLLDVGCGGSLFAALCTLNKIEATVIDPHETILYANDQMKFIGRNITVERRDIFDYNPERKFDAVTLISVIEHVENDEPFLEKAMSLVADNGVICLTVDFHKSEGRYADGHLRTYSSKGLRRLLKVCNDNGFEMYGSKPDWKTTDNYVYTYNFASLVVKKV
jgi:SAM-dependent methyltransferase